MGPQNPSKKLAHAGVLLGHLVSQNRDPKLSDLFFRYSILYLMRFQKVCLTVSVCLCVSVCIYVCVYMLICVSIWFYKILQGLKINED